MKTKKALEAGGCVGIEQESNATFYCGKFWNNSAKWEGGCLYSGVATFVQLPDTAQGIGSAGTEQGFIIYGNTQTFIDNYLWNKGTFDRGQTDIYLWYAISFPFRHKFPLIASFKNIQALYSCFILQRILWQTMRATLSNTSPITNVSSNSTNNRM